MTRTYIDQSVYDGIAAGASWADPTMDPTTIDWAARLKTAAIPFKVVDGRPVNPAAPTGIRYGRNQLGHWGEQQCADAIVFARDAAGVRWLLMVERDDNHGWALPGGHVDPGEEPVAAALRELAEETGLAVEYTPAAVVMPARYVPDPRASDEAWMVTTPVLVDLGHDWRGLPDVAGGDDARSAAWVRAGSFQVLAEELTRHCNGRVFAAHRELLAEVLDR